MISHMAICVTEQMVAAAHRQLPGISNRVRVRVAIEAAVALLAAQGEPLEVPVTVRLRPIVDEQQLRDDIAAAIAQHQADTDAAALDTRIHPWDDIRVTEDGLEGPGVTDATGQTPVTVHEPRVLAGVSEISARLKVGRSTVAGWVKNAADNRMPAPLATLAAGPVYDLDAIEAWHRAWKAAR